MPRKFKFNKKDTIISMYKNGFSNRQIADACRTTEKNVEDVIREYLKPTPTFNRRENLLK